jgi:hypothetical protein
VEDQEGRLSAGLAVAAVEVSPFVLETWGNEDVIAVNQRFRDGGPYQGLRLSGYDLFFDASATRGSGTNVWGKWLPGHSFALVLVNNGDEPAHVVCDQTCYTPMLDRIPEPAALTFTVRDLWARETLGEIGPPGTVVARAVPPHGGAAMLRLDPAAAGLAEDRAARRRPLNGAAFERLGCQVASPTGEWGGQCSKVRRKKKMKGGRKKASAGREEAGAGG